MFLVWPLATSPEAPKMKHHQVGQTGLQDKAAAEAGCRVLGGWAPPPLGGSTLFPSLCPLLSRGPWGL